MTEAVLYAAKSTTDAKGSIPTQLDDCRKLAEQEGLTVVEEFQDESASAYSGDRGPGLAQAIAKCEELALEHGTSVLVVQHSDRLARGDGVQAKHLVEYALWGLKANIVIKSVQDPGTFADLLYAVVTGQRNSEDSRRKSLAVKSGMSRRRSKGLHNGGPPKFGYDYVRDDFGRTVSEEPVRIVEHEAVVVRRIFAEYISGVSQQEIQRRLNADQVSTKRGGPWHQGTVARILGDPFMKGYVKDHDGTFVPGRHEAIVTTEVWGKAEVMRKAGQRTDGRAGARRPKANHLLTNGHLRCGLCGGAMVPRTSGRYEVYKCYARIQSTANCEMPPIPRKIVDDGLIAYFSRVGVDAEATRLQLIEATNRRLTEAKTILDQAKAELATTEANLDRIKGDYKAGKLDSDDWQMFRGELIEEIAASKAKVERMQDQHDRVLGQEVNNAEEAVAQVLADIGKAIGPDAVRAALLRIFESFTLHVRPKDAITVLDDHGRERPEEIALTIGAEDLILERQDIVTFLEPKPRPEVVRDGVAGLSTVRPQALAMSDNSGTNLNTDGLPFSFELESLLLSPIPLHP